MKETNEVLYIGQTTDLKKRHKEHLKGTLKFDIYLQKNK